ncbi:SDR family oxidoreductase [Phenylobacterium sp.]|uniref:SDR family oxidoreductase n=1 Tax=Phenylobacterium sp. TaxID=1871053 RepID=UPI00271C4A13|nr:SDR family oxidoreductase [Phenylobacterium sp.]MDO8802592.1 SDR family oxidoreductase [Phenylobacterium sp.]
MRLFVFGYGFSARALARRLTPQGWTVAATFRDEGGAARLSAEGVEPIPLTDPDAIAAEMGSAQAVLITAPPTAEGCPALPALVRPMAKVGAFPDWIGYLSTTGVYGDRRGRWVFEQSRLAAQSTEGARRVGAERDWLEVGRGMGLTVTIHRLPGIYGPGRSAFDRLREGRARRVAAPGQVFSRIHVDDLAAGLEASIARPRAGGIYNLCDDEPAPNSQVVAYAAKLLGMEPPPEEALDLDALTPAARRFYAETKRVSNARAKAELCWRPQYPTYREGLAAILAAGG